MVTFSDIFVLQSSSPKRLSDATTPHGLPRCNSSGSGGKEGGSGGGGGGGGVKIGPPLLTLRVIFESGNLAMD